MKEYEVPNFAWGAFIIVVMVLGVAFLAFLQLRWPQQTFRNVVQFVLALPLIAWAIRYLVEKWLWHRRPLNLVLQLPDVRGRWEGWTRDSLNPDSPHRLAVECKQSAWRVVVSTWSETGATSHGICGIFFEETPGVPLLMNFGIVENSRAKIANFHNVHLLKLVGENCYLDGQFFNDRQRLKDPTRGNWGWVRVKKVGSTMRGGLALNTPDTWAIPSPPWQGEIETPRI